MSITLQNEVDSAIFYFIYKVNLIDMHHRPDGPYNWIGHYMDHWSKFHVQFALQRKSGKKVAWNLATKVLVYLGYQEYCNLHDNG